MLETILSYSGLVFLPLISLAAFGLTTLLLRLIRLARFPGFRRRFDRELGFLSRGPKLIVLGVLAAGIILPTLFGVLVSPKPQRHLPGSAGHESPLAVESLEEEAPEAVASTPERRETTVAPSSREPAPEAISTARKAVREFVPVPLEEYAYQETVSIPPEAVESGELPEGWEDIDILFVHAHPDDESLDFALLMAAAARSDLTVATLLLTDGEAGVDRYPYRSSYTGYEDRELSGEALGEVRIAEARRALSILGADYYLRLGLPNHPYNAVADEMRLPSLLDAWGGEKVLVTRLEEIVRQAAPRIVVSPDLASGAREHFEHEATGYLVRKVVDNLRRQGAAPGALMVSVDPFQRRHYPATVAIPRTAAGRDLRDIQRAALSQHHTQADASVIGIQRLVDLPEEYYMPIYWDVPESLGGLLNLPQELVSRESPLLEIALAYQQEIGHGSAADVE